MSRRNKFKTQPIAKAVVAFTTLLTAAAAVHAGAGFGASSNPAFANGMRTFYANSPSGLFDAAACFDLNGNAATPATTVLCDSGTALRKFVDSLPGLTPAGINRLGSYIPVASPDTTSYVGSHYYEIAVVEYTQQMHSDLAPTTLRGYVQIDPAGTDAGTGAVKLTNPDGSAIMIARPDATSPTGFTMKQAYGFDKPRYLGPAIVATKDTPVRMKFYNALPVGRATGAARNGDLFLPVDETLPGAGFGPDGMVKFTQNRAEIHLHGGDNPWISDGTPHQWITPAGEADATNAASVAAEAAAKGADPTTYIRGASAVGVPDMPDPGPGAMTYYWPNGGTARLMFYHDHAFGLTRLNVYAGEAAAFVLTDPTEATLPLPTDMIPLVIQDRTFVPANIAQQDARWDVAGWGGPGSLWYPHVWETNQDPLSADKTNPVGRWDWGPFFWPVFPSAMDLPTGEHKIYAPGTRNSWTNTTDSALLAAVGGTFTPLPGPSDVGLSEVTTTPEAFMDTPIVNGVAYPTMTVDPKAYRLRFLNASNDRMLNLGFYVAADGSTMNPLDPYSATKLCDGTEPAGALCTEVKMVPFVSPNSPTATTFSCPASGWTPVSAAYPVSFPCTGGNMGTGWGSADNRPGGVPDPTTAGPNIHLIGNEGGFLAAPVDIPSTPSNYEYNKRSVTVLNVLEHGLFLSNAVRADTVVDFSAYAGKTLILYNDGPAPLPAGDPRIDYYTGEGDQTGAGGAPNTLPGYGPNTRTVMQVKVNALPTGAVATPFNFTALDAAVSTTFAATQPKPIIPETAFAAAYPGAVVSAVDNAAAIFTGTIYLNNYFGMAFTTTDTMTYTPAPGSIVPPYNGVQWKFTWNGAATNVVPQCTTAAACQTLLTAVKAAGPATVPAGTAVKAYVENKTIQELFDPTWGRMNATLGVELPFVTALTQTTIPLGYVDPATETVSDGETQIWKITHNGVDSHPVHFHLVNVQVINRVGWDGTNKGIYPDEAGWKETVRMNPLEDIVVAVKAKKPQMPFGLPHSYRALDPSQPLNVTSGFTQVDPITGNPTIVKNVMDNFMDEYVWHCHILGHEENDFMRAVKFDAKNVLADAPTAVTASGQPGNSVTVSWTDPTPAATSIGNAKNEFGFRVQRGLAGSPVFTDLQAGVKVYNAITQPVNTLANATTYTDQSALIVPPPQATAAPTGNAPGFTTMVVSWAIPAAAAQAGVTTGFNVLRAPVVGGVVGIYTQVNAALVPLAQLSYTDTTVQTGSYYSYQVEAVGANSADVIYRVVAVNSAGDSVAGVAPAISTVAAVQKSLSAGSAALATPMNPVAADAVLIIAGPGATYSWTAPTGAVSYNVRYLVGTTAANGTYTAWASQTGTSLTIAAALNRYVTFQVQAVSAAGIVSTTLQSTQIRLAIPAAPAAPSLVAGSATASTLAVSWPAVAGASDYTVQVATAANFAAASIVQTQPVPGVGAGVQTLTLSTLNPNTRYWIRVSATNVLGTSAASGSMNNWTLPNAPALAPTVANVTATGLNLSYTPSVGGAASYQLQRSTSSTFATVTSTNNFVSGAAVTGLAGNTTYYFRVNAIGGGGTPAASPVLTQLTLPANVAAAPTTAAVTSTGLTLNWAAPTGGAASYNVDVSTTLAFTAGTFTTTNVVGATTQAVSGLSPNTTYYFRVTAVNATGNSVAASPVRTQVTAPAAATSPAVTAGTVTATGLTLTWTAPVGGANSYTVQRSTNGTTWTNATAAITPTGAVVSGLAANTTYFFHVTAVGTGGSAVSVASPLQLTLPAAVTAGLSITTGLTTDAIVSARMNWNAPTGGAASYNVRWDITSAMTGATTVTGVASGTQIQMGTVAAPGVPATGLAANTVVFMQVQAVNATGASAWAPTTPLGGLVLAR
jgi:FtsP/CotA-like multicopper oxidase with cupredoxin domain